MDPPLQSCWCTLRRCATPVLILLLAGTAGAQSPAEEGEAYNNVREARNLARRLGNRPSIRSFREKAEAFLDRYPESARAGVVRLWLGDLLKDDDPRTALAHYRASDFPDAKRRAEDLEFLFAPPPALRVERWIGEARPPDGGVTLVAFFSKAHPQTRRLLRRLERLDEQLGPRGLRVLGVASVVDDPASQTPGLIEAWAKEKDLPFPVAVDEQEAGEASRSLRLYRGNRLPWGALLDRYGRVAWIGPLLLEGNALQQRDEKLRALLAEPGYDALERDGRRGDEKAVRKLASIRTPRSVSSLFAIRKQKPGEVVDDSLRKLLPDGFTVDDADRWKDEKDAYRYSLEEGRLVRRNS